MAWLKTAAATRSTRLWVLAQTSFGLEATVGSHQQSCLYQAVAVGGVAVLRWPRAVLAQCQLAAPKACNEPQQQLRSNMRRDGRNAALGLSMAVATTGSGLMLPCGRSCPGGEVAALAPVVLGDASTTAVGPQALNSCRFPAGLTALRLAARGVSVRHRPRRPRSWRRPQQAGYDGQQSRTEKSRKRHKKRHKKGHKLIFCHTTILLCEKMLIRYYLGE